MRELNRTYRQKDRPTDVLAFAMREGQGAGDVVDLLGDVILSVDTARAQARKAGHDLLAELTMLMTHGVLHLLGWDHETKKKDRLMRAETARLVSLAQEPAPGVRPSRPEKKARSRVLKPSAAAQPRPSRSRQTPR
jgi:probable rRNA maturation factor